jgi:predicted nucleic acid-binding protein
MTTESQYVVVDTNVIVYLITGSTRAAEFEPFLVGKIGLVSFQTVGELRLIARRRGWGERKLADLNDRLKQMVVVGATDQITDKWAELMHAQTVAGSEVLPSDAWVAATALVYRCPVVTNDRKDFERIRNLPLLPPVDA